MYVYDTYIYQFEWQYETCDQAMKYMIDHPTPEAAAKSIQV